jgi:hypothetical protein
VFTRNTPFLGSGFQFFNDWFPLCHDSGRKKLLIERLFFSESPTKSGVFVFQYFSVCRAVFFWFFAKQYLPQLIACASSTPEIFCIKF